MRNYLTLFNATNEEFKRNLNKLADVLSDPTESSFLNEIQQIHDSFIINLRVKTDVKGKTKVSYNKDSTWETINILDKSLDRLINLNQLSIGNAVSGMETTTKHSARIALVLMVCTLLIAIATAFIITRTITRPIEVLIKGTKRIARGKFGQVRISSNDEIALLADAINTMSYEVKAAHNYRTYMIQQISHEIRTPLQVILSAHDILKDQGLGELNPKQLDLLDDISGGIDRLENFSRQYLDLVKIEAGKMVYRMKSVDLPSIVSPLVQEARVIGTRKDVSVNLTVKDVPMIMADSEKIAVVISNLLSNAIKYAHTGGEVWVKLGSCNIGAKLSVQDSGLGIRPEDMGKVFEKFYQSCNSSKIKIRGTGVGLALVKAYTEGHGGSVRVESTVEEGSTFVIELPAAVAEVP